MDETGMPVTPFDDWLRPPVGARVRQHRPHGPFVVQHREDLGLNACRLTRHRTATATTFTVLAYAERSEIGLPCFVLHLEDDRDGRRYVVDTGLCGPGLPPDMFSVVATFPAGD
jgi:hypothetical protein